MIINTEPCASPFKKRHYAELIAVLGFALVGMVRFHAGLVNIPSWGRLFIAFTLIGSADLYTAIGRLEAISPTPANVKRLSRAILAFIAATIVFWVIIPLLPQ